MNEELTFLNLAKSITRAPSVPPNPNDATTRIISTFPHVERMRLTVGMAPSPGTHTNPTLARTLDCLPYLRRTARVQDGERKRLDTSVVSCDIGGVGPVGGGRRDERGGGEAAEE